MKKALISLSLLLILSLSVLTSCAIFGGDGSTDKPLNTDEKIKQIVLYSSEMDILEIRSQIFDITGPIPTVTADADAQACEIVFGDTARPVTLAAKAELEKLKAAKTDADFGYIVYSDGKSIAVYWEHENLRALAVNKFVDKCLGSTALKVSAGAVGSDFFSQKDTEQRVLWLALEQTASEEVYEALRRHNSYINGSVMLEWMANLWDGEIGGFYFSNSARDNEPFRPDIESTAWVVSFLTSSGAMKSTNLELPNDVKMKIVDFAREMQYPDGYFYHPQWDKGTDKLQTDRYGRDLSNASSLINKFTVDRDGDGVEEKQYPKYCTPNGYKCEEHSKNGGSCNLASSVSISGTPLSSVNACSSITSSASLLVSKLANSTVKPTASASERPDYSSAEAFKAWLAEYNATIKENSGRAHNLNALAGEIRAHGYNDIVLEFLQNAQREVYEDQITNGETPSGLWQYEPDYNFAWSIHKYIGFYSYGEASLIYHKEIVESLVKVVALPAEADPDYYALHDHMNQWIAITEVISNAKIHNPDIVPTLYQIMRDNAPALIDNSIEKLEPMKLDNGMFVYSHSRKSPTVMYGVSISKGVAEADTNGMLLLGNYYNAVFEALGYDKIPLCSGADAEVFLDTVINAEPIEKTPLPKPETLDFEGWTLGSRVSLTNNNATAVVELGTDPDDSSNGTLHFYSPAATANDGDHLNIVAADSGGNCAIAEFDMYVESTTASGVRFIQVKIGDAVMLEFSISGEYITVRLASAYSSAKYDDLVTTQHKIEANGTWHTFRVEIYDPGEDESLPHIKFFADEALVKESSCHFGNTFKSGFGVLDVYSMKSVETDIYFDNVFCNREFKDYDPESDDISDSRG